jgi:hypothetical protein
MNLNFFKIILCVFSTVICTSFSAQQRNFNTMRNWSKYRKDYFFGAGFNQFMGDLGGFEKFGKNYSFSSNSLSAQAGYRWRFHPYWATNTRIQIGQLTGNDAMKNDVFLKARNLHFRSFYTEFSQRIELILFAEELGEARFIIKERKYFQFYLYSGLGFILFNPQAKYNEKWTNLHPLRTEGQGLDGGPKPYSRITATTPFGMGYKAQLSEMWTIRFELEYNHTFTNYLDDVGGVYYDAQKLATEIGETSAYLSNPSTSNADWFSAGKARGNKRMDGFYSFSVLFSKNITYKSYSNSRKIKRKAYASFRKSKRKSNTKSEQIENE